MEDTFTTIIGMFIAIIIMFIVPLITIADRSDDISQLIVQTATTNFEDEIIKTEKITRAQYENFKSELTSSMNTYEIDIELKILDPNASKSITDKDFSIGKNAYYSIFSSQIEEILQESDNVEGIVTGKIVLKEGDVISVTVKNDSSTLSQSLRGIYYKVKGEEIHIIAGTASGTIAINGAT